MNALAFPCAPGSTWTWQGTRAIIKVFNVSGLYTPSPGLVSLVAETIGGGAGSGGVVSPNSNHIIGGGGGGSGGYSRIALPAPLVAGGVAVTIGAGGQGSAALANTGGGPGEATTFGAFCVAMGGLGGSDNNGTTGFGQGGQEAVVGVGDLTYPGASGFCGLTFVLVTALNQTGQGGMGGTMFGGSRVVNVGVGEILQGYDAYPNSGAGAAGACANQYATPGGAIGGGAGGSGVCIVTEYCVATNDGCGCGRPGCGCGARVSYGWECG